MANRTIRSTTGSVLGTVATIADTISDVVENIAGLSDIASSSITSWRATAKHQAKIDIAQSVQRLSHEAALRDEARYAEVEALANVDESFRQRYDNSFQKYVTLLEG